jgi:hypothetical protein
MDIVKEKARPLTLAKLDALETKWEAWWAAAHGDDEKAYAKAKSDMCCLVCEFTPQLVAAARRGMAPGS